ncbi:hypothetical protein [Streptomyces sp. NPDC058595]|uniref:hypothetical protein n=1 Tax=Streptomyces sp. NPDC058595 TaxID=3346550 RepID=UPI00364C3964
MLGKFLRAVLAPIVHPAPPVRLAIPPQLPPTARDELGTSASKEEAISYNRTRVATATALWLFRQGRGAPWNSTPVTDLQLDAAVRALGFPYSRPSPETRTAIRAALGVLWTDQSLTPLS